jgi:hypothetical protein
VCGQCQRARLGGAAREHRRVADRQELGKSEPERQQNGERSEELDRSLPALIFHGSASSEACASIFTGARQR